VIPTPVAPIPSLGAARAACRVSVAIPASNEEAGIAATLASLIAQRDFAGRPLDPELFEVIVYVNNTQDATADRVRAFAADHPAWAIHAVEAPPPGGPPHVGHARGTAMALAADRMTADDRDGIVATTDADTRVGPRWIAATMRALETVDAVGGRVATEPPTEAGGRAALALDRHFKHAIVALECVLDPVPWDTWPRHSNHQGASLALHARLYRRIGGVPALAALEDLGLYRALLLADARFRHDVAVQVVTSARRVSRIHGGYASDLDALDAHVRGERPFLVQHPVDMAAVLRNRGIVRTLWHAPPASRAALAPAAALALDRQPGDVLAVVASAASAGRALAAFELDPRPRSSLARLVPIDEATTGLRAFLARATGVATR